jgi:hypothetical protein
MGNFRLRGGKRSLSAKSRKHCGGANFAGSVSNTTPVTSAMGGGGGVAEFAEDLYGKAGSQSAAPGSNVIVMNHAQAGGNALQALIKGGVSPLEMKGGVSPLEMKGGVNPFGKGGASELAEVTVGGESLVPVSVGGGDLAFAETTGGGHPLVNGGAMVDIAVPAALLFANNAYGRRKTGPVHMIGNVGRSVGKRLTRSVGSVSRGLSRSVRFKGRKSQRRRRRTRGGRVRGG